MVGHLPRGARGHGRYRFPRSHGRVRGRRWWLDGRAAAGGAGHRPGAAGFVSASAPGFESQVATDPAPRQLVVDGSVIYFSAGKELLRVKLPLGIK